MQASQFYPSASPTLPGSAKNIQGKYITISSINIGKIKKIKKSGSLPKSKQIETSNAAGLLAGNLQNMQILQQQQNQSKKAKMVLVRKKQNHSASGTKNQVSSQDNYRSVQVVYKGPPQNVNGIITSFKGLPEQPGQTAQTPINFSNNFKKVQFQPAMSTMEQLEKNRRLNSQRQVLIKKHKEPQRRRHRYQNNPLMKHGNGSLFSQTLESKSILSAPTAPPGGTINLKRPSGTAQNTNSSLKQMLRSKTNGFFKKMDRASGSSPTPQVSSQDKQPHTKNFPFIQNSSQAVTPAAKPTIVQASSSPIAVLPPKSMKIASSSSSKPTLKIKPPLHGKLKHMGKLTHGPASVEDVLKLAEEGIANIDHELVAKNQQPEITGKQKISSNFNLSFNNSFNTSYNNGKQEPQATLKFESNTKDQGYSGYITKDAIYLEKQLSDRLSTLLPESSDSTKLIQAFGHTFDEVIKRDKDFGSLLLKIKNAYDVYLEKVNNKESEARSQSQQSRLELAEEKDGTLEHSKRIQIMQAQIEKMEKKAAQQALEMSKMMQMLTSKEEENLTLKALCERRSQELERLANKQLCDKHVQTEQDVPKVSISDKDNIQRGSNLELSAKSQIKGEQGANMSLSISNQSANDLTNQANKLKSQSLKDLRSSNGIGAYENRQQILEDMGRLVKQNKELNEACAEMGDEIHYLKLREKKIMYLVHLLQSKGHPVQHIYEKELKHVSTMRIQEFLDEKEQEHYEREYGGAELDDKYEFSFHTDDSFEAIDDGPMLKPRKPDCVPMLDLEGLPGYETSSDEEEEDQYAPTQQQHYQSQELPTENERPPIHYQESMKYIQDFYDKYHNPSERQSSRPPADNSQASVPEETEIRARQYSEQAPAREEDSIYEDIDEN